jgi:hypothetical protein
MFNIGKNDSLPVEMIEEIDSEHVQKLADFNNNLNREPIYKMTIELSRGQFETLDIYLDSIPEETAFEFCKNNNLDFKAMNYLILEINKLLGREEEKNSDSNRIILKGQRNKAAAINDSESKETVLSRLDINNRDLSLTSSKPNSNLNSVKRFEARDSVNKPEPVKKSAFVNKPAANNKLVNNLYYNKFKDESNNKSKQTIESRKSRDVNVLHHASELINKIKEDADKYEQQIKKAYDGDRSKTKQLLTSESFMSRSKSQCKSINKGNVYFDI